MVNWMAKRINIRPTTSVYATYKNIRYDPWTAIAEFVDNSTQSYYDNTEKLNSTKYWNGLAVDIEYKRDKVSGDHLIIKDNAYGMDFRDFQRAIMLDSPPRKKSRSEFGMGLKTAACWFGKCWSVESVALGSGVKYKTTVDVEALSKYKNEEITVEEIPCSTKDHGTTITIWNLNRTLSGTQIGKTKDQLRGMYRTDLRSGKIKILYNGVGLVYEMPKILTEILPDGKEKVWEKDIDISFDFNGETKRVYGFIGLLDEGSTSGAGFTLIRYGRVIVGGYENGYRPEEIFEKSNSYVYQRLFGELNLDGWRVTQTKDAFDLYGGLEDVLIEKLKAECEDYRKKAKEYRKRPNVDIVETFQNHFGSGNASTHDFTLVEYRPNFFIGIDKFDHVCVVVKSSGLHRFPIKYKTQKISIECNMKVCYELNGKPYDDTVHIIRCLSEVKREKYIFLELSMVLIQEGDKSEEAIIETFNILRTFFNDKKRTFG